MNNLLVSLFIFNDVLIYSMIQFHSGNIIQVIGLIWISLSTLLYTRRINAGSLRFDERQMTKSLEIQFNTSLCPSQYNKRATNESQSFRNVQLLSSFKHKFLPYHLIKGNSSFVIIQLSIWCHPHHLALTHPSAPQDKPTRNHFEKCRIHPSPQFSKITYYFQYVKDIMEIRQILD